MEKENPEIHSAAEGVVDDGVDKAYEFAQKHQIGPLSDEDNKRILRKIDRHLLPLVCTSLAVPCACGLCTGRRADRHQL